MIKNGLVDGLGVIVLLIGVVVSLIGVIVSLIGEGL